VPVSNVTIHIPCPLEQVWHTVTDLRDTSWRSDLKQVKVLSEKCFVEYTKSGYATTFTITACKPLHFWAFSMENNNMSGHWEGSFEPTAGGTRLTCTEVVTAKHWWMRPFVARYLKQQQKRYFEDLRRKVLS
jgi:hypothetical protein